MTQTLLTHETVSSQQQAKGFAATALVLGILALLSSFFGWVAIVLGVAAIVFGVLALKKSQPRGLWLTGIITGSLGVVGGIIVLVIAAMLMSALGTTIDVLETGDLTQLEELGVEFETE